MKNKTQLERAAKGFRALAHPTRIQILDQMRNGDKASPRELTQVITPRISLGTMAHHVRELKAAGMVTAAGEKPVRGAVEHFYRLSPRGRELLVLVDEAAKGA